MGKRKPTNEEILGSLPLGIPRIKVILFNGKEKWKAPGDVNLDDKIPLRDDGTPFLMKKNPGKRRKLPSAPVSIILPIPPPPTYPDEDETLLQKIERRYGRIQQDEITQIARERPESLEILHQVIIGLGEEAAHLRFDRDEAVRAGKDSTGVSNKRVSALKAMADTWLKRMDQITDRDFDMDSKAFQKVFEFILETIRKCLTETGVRPEVIETAYARLSKIADSPDWRFEAKNRMEGKQ